MHARQIDQAIGQRTYAITLDTGDEAMSSLETFVRDQALATARFTATGALSDAALGYFDWECKDYRRLSIDEQVEVATFAGDVAAGADGAPALYVDCVLGRRDGTEFAGELMAGHAGSNLEILLTEGSIDPVVPSGLALLDLA
jgi:predicted DNA-binding protein with PD1-like motif